MSYYNRGNPYGNHNYSPRNNSNNLSEEGPSIKRKRNRFGNKNKAANIEPLFKNPLPSPIPLRSPSAGSSRQSGRDNPFRTNLPYRNRQGNQYSDYVNFQYKAEPTWYWDNYKKSCQSWQEKHKLAYYRSRCLALEFENQMLFEQINSLMEENCIFAEERGEMPSMRLIELSQGQREEVSAAKSQANNKQTPTKNQGKNKPKVSSTPAAGDAMDLNNLELDVEVPQSMMEVMETRLRHLINLKKKRQELDANKSEAGAEIKSDGEKNGGVKKPVTVEEKMDQLYGKDSTLIHKLETSLQLKFNRICDTHKPELWMAIPLNPQINSPE